MDWVCFCCEEQIILIVRLSSLSFLGVAGSITRRRARHYGKQSFSFDVFVVSECVCSTPQSERETCFSFCGVFALETAQRLPSREGEVLEMPSGFEMGLLISAFGDF